MTTEDSVPETNAPADSATAPKAAGLRVKREDEFAVLDIMIVLAERKRIVACVTVGFAIMAILVSILLPVRYTASVVLLPPQQNASVGASLASQVGTMGGITALASSGLGLRNLNEMYVAMLRSRTVEDAMVQRYNLMDEYRERNLIDACKAFEKHATVDGSGKDGLIHISVEDRDPARAAELANGYVDQFRSLSQHLAFTEASQRRLFFEQELEQSKNNLASAEEALKQTEQTTGVVQLDGQAHALIESAVALRAQITAREVQIQGMQTYATDENAQLVQAQRELLSLRAQLAKLGGSEQSSADDLIVTKGRVPAAGLEYVRKLRDVKYYEAIFDILARQFEIAKLDEAKQGALVQVVDPATVPDKRSFPKRGLIVMCATLVGFLIGILAALFQAGFSHLNEDAEANLKLHLLRNALSL